MTFRTPIKDFPLTGWLPGDRMDALSISGDGLAGVTPPEELRPNNSYASRDSSRVCASVPGERWSSGKRRLAIEGNGDVSAILVAGGKAGERTSFCNQEREQMNMAVLAGRNLVQPGFALARARGIVALGTATHNTAFERTTMRATRSALWPRAAQLGR